MIKLHLNPTLMMLQSPQKIFQNHQLAPLNSSFLSSHRDLIGGGWLVAHATGQSYAEQCAAQVIHVGERQGATTWPAAMQIDGQKM